MNRSLKLACVLFVGLFLVLSTGWAEEVTGKIAVTSYGAFKLDDAGTLRLFNMSSKNSLYEPPTWRPAAGDEVRVEFTSIIGRRSRTILVVDRVHLVNSGPYTPANFTSPVEVEITKTGRTALQARTASGHIVKFYYARGTQRLPTGWTPTVGEKIIVSYRPERDGNFDVIYRADKIESCRKN